MSVVATEPAAGAVHPADAPLRVVVDRYLDPDVPVVNAATLSSGEATFAARVGYDPVSRALLVVPPVPLRADLGYTLTVHADALVGYQGETLAEDFAFGFRAGRARAPRTALPPADFDRDVRPVLEAKCDCHGPEPAVYPALTPEALIGARSQRQPDRVLVEPGRALHSYLVQRVLPEYPGVRGLPMPVEAPLDEEALRMLVSWVERLPEE